MSRFRRRLMGLAALRQAKADDFVRVEYIENTSNAYIDTKLFTVYNDGRTYKHIVNLSYTVTNVRQLNGANGNGYFGIDKNGNFECAYVQDSAIAVGDSWHNINFSYYNPTNTSLNIKYEIDNQLIERNPKVTLFDYPYAIFIFAIGGRNSAAPSFFCKERIKSYQIYIDGVLVRDYIPMYQISKDTYGLWDRVNEEFYTSPNGVKFTGGERYDTTDIIEVHPKLIANTYINENTGAQQNYGGWTSTDYIDIEGFKYAMIKISGSNLKYGAYYDKDKKKVGSTTSQVIPTTTKYVRYSTTTSNITNKNVFLFKKVVESSTPYLNNKYINRSGEIADYNGWSVFAEYNYNYVGYNDGYDGVYQASYNANGSKHQYNGYILLERPLGGKVYLSKSGTNITYGIGNKLEYKNMNE